MTACCPGIIKQPGLLIILNKAFFLLVPKPAMWSSANFLRGGGLVPVETAQVPSEAET